MNKDFLFLIFILIAGINPYDEEYASNLYRDRRKCFYTEEEEDCGTTELKRVPGLECCRFELDLVNGTSYHDFDYYYEDYSECRAYFPPYVSETMEKQFKAFIYEALTFIKAFSYFELPRLRETINCSKGSMSYEYGGDDYIKEEDLEYLRSLKNSCLYYYRYSIRDYIDKDIILSIDKEMCENAQLLEQTKKADVWCTYMEIDILFEDKTKDRIKTCYLIPSESFKAKQLNPNIEDALKDVADQVALEKNKNYTEFDVNMFVRDGRILNYNSEIGITDPAEESDSGYFINYFDKIIFFGLILLF